MTEQYWLYGATMSLYTGKARSYLIKQHIAFEERMTSHPDYFAKILPAAGRGIVPVIECPNGDIVQDTTDIIDWFEHRGLSRLPAYPVGPRQHVTALVLELFGNEGLLRQAMHYRWSVKAEQQHFLDYEFDLQFVSPDKAGPEDPEISANDPAFTAGNKIKARMQSYLPGLGIHEGSIAEIEKRWQELLELLEEHFRWYPYLLGGQPSIGDYGLMCSLFAHLGRDPVPAALMRKQAPRVARWVERMNRPNADMPEYRDATESYLGDDQVPDSLIAVLRYIANLFLPEMEMTVKETNRLLDKLPDVKAGDAITPKPHIRMIGGGTFQYGDVELTVPVTPIKLWLLQRITDCIDDMSTEDRQAVTALFDQAGLTPLSGLKARRRVARKNNLEVWGDAVPV